MSFTKREWEAHLARMERCRLSGCDSEAGEHKCMDSEGEWATFDGPEAA